MKKLITKLSVIASLTLAVFVFAPYSYATVILNVDNNGNLMGATGVVVNGTEYDVAFQNGSCTSLYHYCENIPFTSQAQAAAASQALMDQVFTGTYNDNPWLTNGCVVSNDCHVYSPDIVPGAAWGYAVFLNYSLLSQTPDEVYTKYPMDPGYDTTGHGDETFAVWTAASTSPVPLPPSLALLSSGLMVMVGISRKRKHMLV